MRRRTVLRALALAGVGLAGCSGEPAPDGTATPGATGTPTPEPTPTPTPACYADDYDVPGKFGFGFGIESTDGERYDATLRVRHTRIPPCRYETPSCGVPERAEVVAEISYVVTDDRTYELVEPPLTEDVDTYTVELQVGDATASEEGIEEKAAPLTDREYDFLVCHNSMRNFLLRVEDGQPTIRRASPPS